MSFQFKLDKHIQLGEYCRKVIAQAAGNDEYKFLFLADENFYFRDKSEFGDLQGYFLGTTLLEQYTQNWLPILSSNFSGIRSVPVPKPIDGEKNVELSFPFSDKSIAIGRGSWKLGFATYDINSESDFDKKFDKVPLPESFSTTSFDLDFRSDGEQLSIKFSQDLNKKGLGYLVEYCEEGDSLHLLDQKGDDFFRVTGDNLKFLSDDELRMNENFPITCPWFIKDKLHVKVTVMPTDCNNFASFNIADMDFEEETLDKTELELSPDEVYKRLSKSCVKAPPHDQLALPAVKEEMRPWKIIPLKEQSKFNSIPDKIYYRGGSKIFCSLDFPVQWGNLLIVPSVLFSSKGFS